MSAVVIDERFCGPPGSANGGYAAGLLARGIAEPAEVTLRVPPPLGRPLSLQLTEGSARLLDGDVLIAEAEAASVEVEVPEPVGLAEATRATHGYPWYEGHPYPTCFVCGTRRAAGDGMEIFPGPVAGSHLHATAWTPAAELGGPDGVVADEFVWAALDCPTGVVVGHTDDVGQILLGRLAVDIRRPVRVDRPHVIQAWPIGRDGRKLHAASAVLDAGGVVCAVGRATWIELK